MLHWISNEKFEWSDSQTTKWQSHRVKCEWNRLLSLYLHCAFGEKVSELSAYCLTKRKQWKRVVNSSHNCKVRWKATMKVAWSSEIETKCNKIHISIGLIVLFMIPLRYMVKQRRIIRQFFAMHIFSCGPSWQGEWGRKTVKHALLCVNVQPHQKHQKWCLFPRNIFTHSQQAKRWKRTIKKGRTTTFALHTLCVCLSVAGAKHTRRVVKWAGIERKQAEWILYASYSAS